MEAFCKTAALPLGSNSILMPKSFIACSRRGSWSVACVPKTRRVILFFANTKGAWVIALAESAEVIIFFMVFLYIQCFLGFLLFFVFSDKAQGASSYIEADRQLSLRFWALEHFVVMLFTLILSQIGYIFIIKANSDLNKHKNTMFYYGLSLLLIFVSMSANLIF